MTTRFVVPCWCRAVCQREVSVYVENPASFASVLNLIRLRPSWSLTFFFGSRTFCEVVLAQGEGHFFFVGGPHLSDHFERCADLHFVLGP